MDSSSSGSLPSSGGGEEEFDSRGDSFSPFLNSSLDMSSIQQLPPPPRLHTHHQNNPSYSFLDPLSSCFDIFNQSTPPPTTDSLLNLDMVLSRGGFSGGLMGSSMSSAQQAPTTYRTTFQNPNPGSMPSSSGGESSPRAPAPSDPSNAVASRNPKKRTRASRRAPTTVLTTDTSNFRAMVQEFTGIPPPPFSSSPFFGSRGLNFLSASSSMRSGLVPPLSYPLRPSAHKVLPPSFLSSSMFSSAIASSTSNTAGTISNTTTATFAPTTSSGNRYNPISSYNYQLPCDLGLPRQSQNFLNIENPTLTLQSHLQPSRRYPFPNVSILGTKSQTQNFTMTGSVLEEFNRSHGQLNTDDHGNATKSITDEWAVIEEQHQLGSKGL